MYPCFIFEQMLWSIKVFGFLLTRAAIEAMDDER